ncbi:MAG: glycosyl transferase [Lachnospiraceae bacterium]|nr:glycosyl transferase [Lachnospiraceae bacterium]
MMREVRKNLDRAWKGMRGRLLYLRKDLPDEEYLKKEWKIRFGRELDLEHPKTFNEKIQWLKLYYRDPMMTDLVDKYKVKKHVAKIIGEEHVIPTLGVWKGFEEIDFSKLPDQFVLKCNHDSGGIVICKDKRKFNCKEAKRKLEKSMKRNFYYAGREWAYKDVAPVILAEAYIEENGREDLKDYKIFHFQGKAKLIQVDYDRFSGEGHKRNLYTPGWKYIEGSIQYPSHPEIVIPRPEQLEKMIELSERLAQGFPHVRTDFYIAKGNIYFGEMTFYHGSGTEYFRPEALNRKMGDWLVLPEKR